MATNSFKTFCPDDTGTNLLDVGTYDASPDRVSGNKPGVASSKLNNRALRQANMITSQIAQYLSNTLNQDVSDVDGGEDAILAQMEAVFAPLTPTVQRFTSGSGTYNLSYRIFVSGTANATIGATYTNNSITFTVKDTLTAGKILWVTGSGAPTSSGTLTKTSGTGDSTIEFLTFRAPIALEVEMIGNGAGGYGSGLSGGTAPTAGGNVTFGSSLLTAGGGSIGARGGAGGAGGSVTVNSPAIIMTSAPGGAGGSGTTQGNSTSGASGYLMGGIGGSGANGGAGYSGPGGAAGGSAATNSGAGGGGGGTTNADSSNQTGAGGGSGGFLRALIVSPSTTYAYALNSAGSAGTAGTAGFAGGAGAQGYITVFERYQ